MTEAIQVNETASAEAATLIPPKKTTKCRWLKWTFAIFIALLLALVLLLSSGKGQRSLIELVDRWLDDINIGQVEGSLQEGLRLHDVNFAQKGVDVAVGQAKFQVNFSCLIQWQEICIPQVTLRDTKVQVQTALLPPSEQSSSSSGTFELPVGISITQLSLDNIQINVDDTEVSLTHFHTGLKGKGKTLTISPTELQGLNISLPQAVQKTSEMAKNDPKVIDWNAIKAQLSQPILDKSTHFLEQMELSVEDLHVENVQIHQQTEAGLQSIVQLESLALRLLTEKTPNGKLRVQLSQLSLKSDRGNLNGSAQLSAEQGYPVELQLQAELPEWKEISLPASQIRLQLQGQLLEKTQLELNTQGAFESRLSGSVQLTEPRTPFHLTLKSPLLNYPFSAPSKESVKVKQLVLELGGDLLAYQLQGGLELSGIGIPTGALQIAGQGGLTEFNLDKLSLEMLKGLSTISGKITWQEGLSWDSKIHLQKLYTQDLFPEWRAFLSGQLNVKGRIGQTKQDTSGQDWAISFNQMKLAGVLGGKPLVLSGEVNANSQDGVFIPALNIHHGISRIESQGRLSTQSDFSAKIHAPSLKGLWPKLNGSLMGNVHLRGDIQQPQLNLDLRSETFSYNQLQLQGLTAKGEIRTEQQIAGQIQLGLRQFNVGDWDVRNLVLELTGSEKNHQLKFSSSGEPLALNLNTEGSFDRSSEVWQGKIREIALITPIGQWKNDKPVQVGFDHKKTEAAISAHCWLHSQAQLCFPRAFTAGIVGTVPFELKQLDLAIVAPFIKDTGQIAGVVKAEGEAQWSNNQPPKAKIGLNANQIKFEPKMDYRRFPLVFTPVKIDIELAENNLTVNSDIALENNGRLKGKVQLKDLPKQRHLSGDVKLSGFNLSLIKPLLGREEQINGTLIADLTLGGNLQSPLVHGNIKLEGLKSRLLSMPFDIINGGLNIALHGARSELSGQIQTKDSQLNLEGEANWQQPSAWYTRISAKANRFKFDLPGIAKLELSPDIEATAKPNMLSVSGKVDIPWARVAIEGLPESAISVSKDEIIMEGSSRHKNRQTMPVQLNKSPAGMTINSDVAIHLGDDVKLDAYGLKTNLQGTIKVNQGKKGLGLYGQVNLKKGTFNSFGQDLVIRKGVISFTGLPSQPTLDVEAIRNPEAMEDSGITAGVRVTGMADAPDVKIFSNPSLPQDQALSYILTGRALDNTGDASSGNSVAAALIGMSLSKSSKLVGQVGGAFGIQDLNVTTAGIGDNTKVVVSGNLSSRFTVKYGVGLFAPLTELTLRYRLAPNLYLQGVSSIDQAVDLLYHFEF